MKEYRTNEELIIYLESKGVNILDKEDAIQKIERYTYYSIVNTYKSIFKDKDGLSLYHLTKYMLYLNLIKS